MNDGSSLTATYNESRSRYHNTQGYNRRQEGRDVPVAVTGERGDGSQWIESSGQTLAASPQSQTSYVDVITEGSLTSAVASMALSEGKKSPEYTLGSSSSHPPIVAQRSPVTYQPLNSSVPSQTAGGYGQSYPQGQWQAQPPNTTYGSNQTLSPFSQLVPQSAGPPRSNTQRHVAGTVGETEELDKSYKQRNRDYKKWFKPGRVFATLWTDPFADTTSEATFESFVSIVRFGERVHSKIRRFVVVKQGDRSCTCLPVTTYDGKGYEKRGIVLNDHGQIYSADRLPEKIPGIDKNPLKVIPGHGTKRLANSFVCYSRAYNVETNVKVKDVGELDATSRRLLRKYWNEIMTLEEFSDGYIPPSSPQSTAEQLRGIGERAAEDYSGHRGGETFASSPRTDSPEYYPSSQYSRHSSAISPGDKGKSHTTIEQPVAAAIQYAAQPGYGAHQNSSAASYLSDAERYSHSVDVAGHSYSRNTTLDSSSVVDPLPSTVTSDRRVYSAGEHDHSINFQANTEQASGGQYGDKVYSTYHADGHNTGVADSSTPIVHASDPVTQAHTSSSEHQVQSITSDRKTRNQQGRTVVEYSVEWVGIYGNTWVTAEYVPEDMLREYNASKHRPQSRDKVRPPSSAVDTGDDGDERTDHLHDITLPHRSSSSTASKDNRGRRHRDSDKGHKKRSWF
jgi:hypothetical protein